MATTWADIVAAALVQIDDVRLEEQMAVSPAQFYRRMSALILQAIPLLARPPELLGFLEDGMVIPFYDDYKWTSDETSTTQATQVPTGMLGYDLCSVTRRVKHDNGTISLAPYPDAVYDPETGIVTMPVQESAGIGYDFDFYTDGYFSDLSKSQMRLFALSVAVVWDERFSRNWLANTMKIKDDSFKTADEPQYIEKTGKYKKENRIAFNDELRSYEQLCAYNAAFKGKTRRTELV